MTQPNKRQFRQASLQTRTKMSQAQKGKPKSETHKQRISQSMIDYWRNVPNQPTTSTTYTCQGYDFIKNNDDNTTDNDNI